MFDNKKNFSGANLNGDFGGRHNFLTKLDIVTAVEGKAPEFFPHKYPENHGVSTPRKQQDHIRQVRARNHATFYKQDDSASHTQVLPALLKAVGFLRVACQVACYPALERIF